MENKRLNQEQFDPGPGHMNLPPVDVFFSLVDWFIEVDISIEEPMIKWIGPNWSSTFFFQLVKQRLNMFAATLTLRRVWLQVDMKIKLMLLPQPTYCSEGMANFNEMMVMMMMMMMMIMMIMTIESVEQRPGWGEHV